MKRNRIIVFALLTFYLSSTKAQINLVGNPSFEYTVGCNFYLSSITHWSSTDSAGNIFCGGGYFSKCNGQVPKSGNTYQWPRTGNAYVICTEYCLSPTCPVTQARQYPKNRLLTTLTAGKVYCATMYVNICNTSPYGNDGFGMYFGDASLDTIKQCGRALTFLIPQVKNPVGNIITDTLGWTKVSGTFTATGIEKYLLIGNFTPDSAINKTFINPQYSGIWTDVLYDDISVIEVGLPASAGPDKNINLGDSAFIGIPPVVGLECTWTSGSFTVGTGSGIWVKPTSPGTYSYVVTQDICGNIKTDTVNVNVSPSLLSEHTLFSQSIGLYPQPANDIVKLTFRNYSEEAVSIEIVDTNGKIVYSKEEYLKNNSIAISLGNLSDGIYYLKIHNSKDQFAAKKLTVTH